MWVAVGIVGGAIVGGVMANNAADKASKAQIQASQQAVDAQTQSANKAADIQWQMYQQSRQDQLPWLQAGGNALSKYQSRIDQGIPSFNPIDFNAPDIIKAPGMDDYTKSPGYESRLNEGLNGIQKSAAAKGGLLSGATLKALDRFSQDYATNDYQNFLNNYYNAASFKRGQQLENANFLNNQQYNKANFLSNQYYNSLKPYEMLSGLGQNTANQVGSNALTTGANVANTQMANGNANANALLNMGNARASGYINKANNMTGLIQGGMNAFGYMYPYM